jgi:hypothetical protein
MLVYLRRIWRSAQLRLNFAPLVQMMCLRSGGDLRFPVSFIDVVLGNFTLKQLATAPSHEILLCGGHAQSCLSVRMFRLRNY